MRLTPGSADETHRIVVGSSCVACRSEAARKPQETTGKLNILSCDWYDKYDTIRNAILTCAQKLTRVSLIYRTEPRTKKGKQQKKL